MAIEMVKRLGPYFAEVICAGPYSTPGFLTMLDEALDYAATNGRKAVLIDLLSINGGPGARERVGLAVSSAELQLGKPALVAIALVGREPMIHPERIGETVARDRCAVLSVFEDRDEAVVWLEHTSG